MEVRRIHSGGGAFGRLVVFTAFGFAVWIGVKLIQSSTWLNTPNTPPAHKQADGYKAIYPVADGVWIYEDGVWHHSLP